MPKTVLIADESVTIRSVAESLLRGESYSVHSAADGNMALELAAAEQPDLALIGEKLAGIDGAEVCKTMKADSQLGKIPVIFMRTDRPGPVPDHADAVLTKPFSPQSLLDTVRQFLHAGTGEGTSPVAIMGSLDEDLEEELIDSALGLDDVGPSPGEELTISPPGVADGLDPAELKELEEAQPLGLVKQESTESGEVGSDSPFDSALDEAFSFADDPPAPKQPETKATPEEGSEAAAPLELESVQESVEDEVDEALDAAFGEVSASETGSSSPDQTDHSLKEVSLGDDEPDAMELISDASAISSAGPAGTIDLEGGADSEDDKPHDYDWFIKEMQDASTKKADPSAAPPHEPPKIEPVTTKPASEIEDLPPAEPPRHSTSSDIRVEGSEELQRPRAGYDEFISEFKAEIAKIEGVVPPDGAPPVEETENTKHSHAGTIAFEDTGVGQKSPAAPPSAPSVPATAEEAVRELGDGLIDSVTSQVARELAAKIDSKVIYQLIEQKLREVQKNKDA